MQKLDICIGSRVASILSDVFVAKTDRSVHEQMKGIADRAFGFVEYYLVIDQSKEILPNHVLELFKRSGNGLTFTMETLKEGAIQFLDLRLKFERDHVCWSYAPRSEKPLLSFASTHSKLVK